jgi:hypothetical protein
LADSCRIFYQATYFRERAERCVYERRDDRLDIAGAVGVERVEVARSERGQPQYERAHPGPAGWRNELTILPYGFLFGGCVEAEGMIGTPFDPSLGGCIDVIENDGADIVGHSSMQSQRCPQILGVHGGTLH